MWGDPVAQADVWKAHDPTDNAAALKGTALYVAYGNGKLGPLDDGAAPYDPAGAIRSETLRSRAQPSSISSRRCTSQ